LINRFGSASPRGFHARDPPGHGTADWAAQAVQAARAMAGWAAPNSAQSRSPIKKFFFFFKSIL
jgi:hypothetical protein